MPVMPAPVASIRAGPDSKWTIDVGREKAQP